MTEYRLPKRFWDDHSSRIQNAGTVNREIKSHYYVELNREQYDDLLSDADYYSNHDQFDSYMMGLCSSAVATYKILTDQGPPSTTARRASVELWRGMKVDATPEDLRRWRDGQLQLSDLIDLNNLGDFWMEGDSRADAETYAWTEEFPDDEYDGEASVIMRASYDGQQHSDVEGDPIYDLEDWPAPTLTEAYVSMAPDEWRRVARTASTRRLWRGLQFGEVDADEFERIRTNAYSWASSQLKSSQIGIHWTDDPVSAENFALDRDPEGWAHDYGYDEDEEPGYVVGLILEAEVPEEGVIDRDSQEADDYAFSDSILDYGVEREVTVRADTPIQVTSVDVVAVSDDGVTWSESVSLSMGTTASVRSWDAFPDSLPARDLWGPDFVKRDATAGQDQWESTVSPDNLADAKRTGLYDQIVSEGVRVPIDVFVPKSGPPEISSGHHRISVAHELEMDVPIRWYGPGYFEATGERSSREGSKEAAWSDVRSKAVRLRNSGAVTIVSHTDRKTTAMVEGDHETYKVELWRSDPDNHRITIWNCSCPWGYWAPRRQILYIGRTCSHALAVFYEARSRDYRGISDIEARVASDDPEADEQIATLQKRIDWFKDILVQMQKEPGSWPEPHTPLSDDPIHAALALEEDWLDIRGIWADAMTSNPANWWSWAEQAGYRED